MNSKDFAISPVEIAIYLDTHDADKFSNDVTGYMKDCQQLVENMMDLYKDKLIPLTLADVHVKVSIELSGSQQIALDLSRPDGLTNEKIKEAVANIRREEYDDVDDRIIN